ncbi:MAG: PrsW family intramembrane metalloprotease, partial [Anaerolineales bacterium]
GSARQSDFKNYTAHRAFYAQNLSPNAGGLPATVYAHIQHDQENQKTIVQYWLFYYYNDWFNKHEGDWEMVQIVLDHDLNPDWVIYSQHHGGTRRSWEDTHTEELTHPSVYVALGSHANYFWGNEIYPNSMQIGNKRVEILDRTGNDGRIIPNVILLPSMEELSTMLEDYSNVSWLIFNGHWGELSLQGDFGGPSGPATKGNQWEQPYLWGMEQPLDDQTWYLNRLKIQVQSNQPANFTVQSNQILPQENVDIGSNFLIYHNDPPDEILVSVETSNTKDTSIVASWPQKDIETVYQYQFQNFHQNQGETFDLDFSKGKEPGLFIGGSQIQPSSRTIEHATWNAPDLVWFAGYLPASQIALGLLISITAGVFPGLFFIILIYYFDRYEKEPLKLVFTAILWGAIPSILVVILVQIFFSLPPDFINPAILDAVQTGLIAPLTEEAIKGAILIFIAVRYRKEVNDVLDGIIYGAIVGIGFAISGNTIGFIGSFLVSGFQGLGIIIFMEGFLSGLNQALYSAIFGAGLAYFLTKNNAKKFLWVPAGAFLLAVITNGLHELLTSSILNQPIIGFIVNWSGIFTIVVIMLGERKREKDTIREFLADEIPGEQIQVVLHAKKQRTIDRTPQISQYKFRRALKHQINLLTRLAFFKKSFRQTPSDETGQEISNIRQQIMNLNQQTKLLEKFPLHTEQR